MSAEQSNAGSGNPPARPGRPGLETAGTPAPPGQVGAPPGPATPQGPRQLPGRPTAGPAPAGRGGGHPGGGGFARFAVDHLVPFAVGLCLTILVYFLIVGNLPASGMCGEIRAGLADRGFIPYVCTMLLFWQVSHLAIRYFVRIMPEFAAMGENLIPAAGEFSGREIMEMTRRVVMAEATRGPRLLTRRLLLAAEHLRLALNSAELGDLLRHSASADRERIASARALPSFLFWAIPVLGFAGTVGGIGTALGAVTETGAAVSSVKATGLGAAFDILLVAVFMTLAALFVQMLVRHSESRLLAEVEDYLNRNLQARIRTETVDSRMQDIAGETLRRLADVQEDIRNNQTQVMAANVQTVTGAQRAIQEAVGAMPQVLSVAAASAAQALGGTVQEGSRVAQQILTNLDAKATDIAQNLGTEFGRVTSDLASALKDITGRLAESFQSARELTEIQAALQRNLEELNKIHDLGHTLSDVKETLAALKPVLASLNRPIPLRFTLEEGEIGIGGMPGGGAVVR